MTSARSAVVIGAGVAGLATAALLARDGFAVRVVERHGQPGGRAGVLRRGGYQFDTGPSWFLMPEVYDHFLRLLGTSLEQELDVVRLDPEYRVFSGANADPRPGEPVTIPDGYERIRALFEARQPGLGPALDRYVRDAEALLELAREAFLYNPFRRWRVLLQRRIVRGLPIIARQRGRSLAKLVRAMVNDPVLRQILEYPAVFIGTDPRQAPGLYQLMSAMDLKQGVFYPRGGFAAVIDLFERLARESGVQIDYDTEVTQILVEGHRAVGVAARRRGDEAVTRIDAEVVVSGADLHHTETALLPKGLADHSDRWWDRTVSGPGGVIAMLGVQGELPTLAHHNLFFAADWDGNFDAIAAPEGVVPEGASFYLSRTTATDPQMAPAGCEALFLLIPVPANPGIGRGGSDGHGDPEVEAAVDAAIARISEWAAIPDLASRIQIRETLGPEDYRQRYHSWQGGLLGPAHILRQSAMFRAQHVSDSVDGLYFAGATVAPGVGVPMCLISAEVVLKHIRGDVSAGPLPEPLPASSQRVEQQRGIARR